MKNTLRILFVLMLVFSLVAVLASCGETPVEPEPEPEPSPAEPEPEPEVTKYTVTFKANGSVVEEKEVEEGDVVVAPEAPEKTGYTFKEWRLSGAAFDFATEIDDDIELVAFYEEIPPEEYTVVFKLADGTVLDTQTVIEGRSATLPTAADGYVIVQKDDQDFSAVNADMEIVCAQYELAKYAYKEGFVNLVADLDSMNANWNGGKKTYFLYTNEDYIQFTANMNGELKAYISKGGNSVTNWDVTANIVIYVDGAKVNTLAFDKDWTNGQTVICSVTPGYHTVKIAVEDYAIGSADGYAYNDSGINITGLYGNVYDDRHVVTFQNDDGVVLGTQNVHDGENAHVFDTADFVVVDYDADDLKNITEDTIVVVSTEVHMFKATFKTADGTLVEEKEFVCSSKVVLPDGYVLDVNDNLGYIRRDWTYIVIESKEYTITFVDAAGDTVATSKAITNAACELPTIDGYYVQQLDDQDLSRVRADMTVKVAKYDKTKYNAPTSGNVDLITETLHVADWNSKYVSMFLYVVDDYVSYEGNFVGDVYAWMGMGGNSFTSYEVTAVLEVYLDNEKVNTITVDKNWNTSLAAKKTLLCNVAAGGIHEVKVVLASYECGSEEGYGKKDSGVSFTALMVNDYNNYAKVTFMTDDETPVSLGVQKVQIGSDAHVFDTAAYRVVDYDEDALKNITEDKTIEVSVKAQSYEVTFMTIDGKKAGSQKVALNSDVTVPDGYALYKGDLAKVRRNYTVLVTKIKTYNLVGINMKGANATQMEGVGMTWDGCNNGSWALIFTQEGAYVDFTLDCSRLYFYVNLNTGLKLHVKLMVDDQVFDEQDWDTGAATDNGNGALKTTAKKPVWTFEPGVHHVRFILESVDNTQGGNINQYNGFGITYAEITYTTD